MLLPNMSKGSHDNGAGDYTAIALKLHLTTMILSPRNKYDFPSYVMYYAHVKVYSPDDTFDSTSIYDKFLTWLFLEKCFRFCIINHINFIILEI